ncbi:sensor histidine kinase [Paenibacillus sp. R14(2021)]|uniref:sensor histidine kinase n=1 Tax=Paenibacillus sp. R14(2021) TaxID=2859228 RepID=UPI001C61535E|nr:sensor histidine kinase [Paenibacillus sp. R14(2021)]
MNWLFMNRTISVKIVWSTVLISLIPLLLLSSLFYWTSTNSLEKNMFRSSNQNADYLSNYLNQYFRNMSTSALQVYAFDRIVNLMAHGANYSDADIINVNDTLDNYYQLVVNKNKDIMKIMMFGKDNTLRDAWSRATSYNMIKVTSIPNYKAMLDLPFQQAMAFTYHDKALNQDFFVYSMTIYDPFYRTKFGTLVFYVQKKDFVAMVEANNRPPNVIVLQNENGQVIYRTNEQHNDAVKPYARPEKRINNSPLALKFTKNHDLLVGTADLDNANVGLTIVYPNPELAQNRKNTLLITVGALGFVLIVIILFSALAQRFITRPIQLLGKAMRAVRSGNFEVSLAPYPYRDDLSELTRNFNFMTEKIRELIESEFKTQLRNKEAQILALQMQINPHFLYNTLQTIGGKAVLAGDYDIHEMCRALGDMFRYSFYEGNMESTIGQELEHVNNYLYIQQLRFEASIETDFEVDPALMACSITRFVLQPIIENVMVHVLGKQEQHQLQIGIKAEREGDSVRITLQDNGPGMEPEKLAALQTDLEQQARQVFSGVSIGLRNVHERIRLIYGQAYGLEIKSAAGEGTTISIRIPYKNRGETHV